MTRREEAIYVLQNTSFFGRSMDNIDSAINMAIKALELVGYIEQRYEEECNERRKYYADGSYHSLSMSDGASYVLGQVLEKWKESVEDKE